MAIPVSVVLDRVGYGLGGALDLSSLVADGSLRWSSVVPGGFASCSFELHGDFRQLVKQIPYLSTLRVIGDSGGVLWEGQIEDLTPTLSGDTVGLKVGAFGLQNALREVSTRTVWSKRDMNWVNTTLPIGSAIPGGITRGAAGVIDVALGTFDPSDLTKAGVQFAGTGVSVPYPTGEFAEWVAPQGITFQLWLGTLNRTGTDAATSNFRNGWWGLESGTWTFKAASNLSGTNAFSVSLSSATAVRIAGYNTSGSASVVAADSRSQNYDMRLLGTSLTEDVTGGFYGGSLIRNLLSLVPTLGAGAIETGSDFTIDHLDASVRRNCQDILNEIASYYTRDWAVWEDAKLDWTSPNLAQPQWIIPISQLAALDLDASVVNSQSESIVLYTDAATGLTAEASTSSSDRRNPYVLNGRTKDALTNAGFPMTANTAPQLSTVILNDLGFGPVPAAGTISLPGETIIQHAQGNAAKAWELRAGDNVTIPELPLADVFTTDGRGECLFHIVSADADGSTGLVTLSLDSYGSKRSDVLLARLAAVTSALGG